jgi:uncharacterized protein YdcH (DUF465 family)
MDNRFNRLEDKLDKLDTRLDGIDKLQERLTVSVEEHVKRTNGLEDYIKDELPPIKAHVILVQNAFKVFMWVAMALGSVVGFLAALHKLLS